MGITDWFYTWFFKLKAFPFVIQVAIVFITASIIFSILFQVYILFIRKRYQMREDLEKKITPLLETFFDEIIFKNKYLSEKEVLDEYKNIIRKKTSFTFLNRKKTEKIIKDIAIEIFISIKEKKEIPVEKHLLIIKSLSFEKHLLKKLNIKSISTKKRAISDLSGIGALTSDAKILPHLYSKDKDLQVEAGISYLQLSKNDPYRFFDEVKGVLTDWYQLKLMDVLIQELETTGKLPHFGRWISYSKNDYLIIFLLKATAYFNQKESIAIVRLKTESKNASIRKEAYLTLGKLHDVAYEKKLKKVYFKETEENQIAIIKTIGFLDTGKSIDFLETTFNEVSSIDLRKQIALIIYGYGNQGKILFNNLKQNIKNNLNKEKDYHYLLFKHIENNLILFK